MPCEDCLSRREFLTRSTVAVAGAVALAAGCGDGQFGPTALRQTNTGVSLKVASLPELATVGQLVKIPVQTGLIAVKRTGPASFAAISTVCTHQGCEVNINSGAFDPFDEIIPKAHAIGAWVHVDGAFGLWALGVPSMQPL